MRKNILIIFLILIIAGLGFYIFWTKTELKIVDTPRIDERASAPSTPPYFSTPKKNAKVASPLTVQGAVPSGWMFEGIVPVKLLDENKNVITQAPGEEVNPGAWMDEEPDQFTATLTFTTTAKSGYLVVGADNPSGLPENDKSYEIPVKF